MGEPPTCPYCHLRFQSRSELLDHLTRDHPERGGRKGMAQSERIRPHVMPALDTEHAETVAQLIAAARKAVVTNL